MKFRWLLIVFCSLPWISTSVSAMTVSGAHKQKVRAIHFVLRAVSYQDALRLIDQASMAQFNTVVVVLTDGVVLDSAPWKPRVDAWKKKELSDWVDYANLKGLAVIPELKLLTHQEKFFQHSFPTLMFNEKTYNPKNTFVYYQIFPLLDEVIKLIHPKAIHIGHDEVKGWAKSWKRRLKELAMIDDMLPADLFLEDVKVIHTYLRSKGIETWMWGDMLLSPEEFPETTRKWPSYHGGVKGYGKVLRDQLPKDIVICDWQYHLEPNEFPSLGLLRREGFRVLGATWKKEKTIQNFSYYAAHHGADGMIATTWFHVQRKEWDVVDRIIKLSGQTFLKDFPDAK